jgi:anaerobic selenocysteine-containing dehydrogenase
MRDVPVVRRGLLRAARNLPERLIDLMLRLGGSGLTLARLADAPHGIDRGPLTRRGGRQRTPSGRPQLAPPVLVADLARLERWVDAARTPGLVLIGRRHLRSNNSWLHNVPSLVKGPDRTRLHMNPADAAARGLVDGAAVRVTSRTGSVEVRLAVTADVMPGVVSLPHGFGQSVTAAMLRVAGALAAPSANALTDEALVEPIVGTSILNGVPVEVARDGA